MREDFSFMNEKIKEKPFYKKKWVKLAASTAALGLLFGGVSGVVFVKTSAWVQEKQAQEQIETIEIPKDEAHPSPDVTATPAPVVVEAELTIEKYEKLYDEIQRLAQESSKSLVTVTAVNNDVDWFNEAYETSGQSAGMIIGDNSVELLILTKYASVKSCDGIRVAFADKTSVSGELKKYDVSTGLAVISVNLSDISSATNQFISKANLGNSVALQPGEPIIAIGRADGSESSVKIGTLTSVHNSKNIVDAEYVILNTDLIKNPGSDGVLINLKGQVVGFITEQNTQANMQSVITAYGISDLKSLIEHMSNNQDVTYLGIRGMSVTAEAKSEGMPKGVYVTEVEMDSPAMLGGIQNGDVIQKINGQSIESMKDISAVLQKLSNKQNITVEGRRLTKDGYKTIEYKTALSVLE